MKTQLPSDKRREYAEAERFIRRNGQRTIDGTLIVIAGCCETRIYTDGGFDTSCSDCAEEIAYGSVYGSDGSARVVARMIRHARKH